ncbi:proteinase inhibitor I4 serpin [Kitasatospora sp. NPDC001261]|uniref:proteinase inhibitor I4 serpin n=1 Tax=unclassified Kitasatospora TaxID=2633591 RepID=UPI0036779C9F
MSQAEAVRVVNTLGARWVGQVDPEGGTVLMPAGVWPLLGLLAPAGSPAVQGELTQALGLPPEAAAERARELLGLLEGIPAVGSALGLWTGERLRLRPEWPAGLPAGVHGRLSGDVRQDQARLDAWAARATGGLIDAMPVRLDRETRLVLAAALTVRTDWIRPFDEIDGPPEGPADAWGRPVRYLSRYTCLLDRAAVLESPTGLVTEVRVHGYGDISVHLLLGEPGASPGRVLATGIEALSGRHRRTTADRLPVGTPGPGLTIDLIRRYEPEDLLAVDVPRFTVGADHDLLARPDLFGLATLGTRSETEHRLPGLGGAEPLFIDGARQRATATFGPDGFRAASVTALGVAGSGAARPRPSYLRRIVRAGFGRPFGFVAVHRTSGLLLAAGWVTDPDPASGVRA